MKIFVFKYKKYSKTSNCFIFGHLHPKIKPFPSRPCGIFLVRDNGLWLIIHGLEYHQSRKIEGAFMAVFGNLPQNEYDHLKIFIYMSFHLPPDTVGYEDP